MFNAGKTGGIIVGPVLAVYLTSLLSHCTNKLYIITTIVPHVVIARSQTFYMLDQSSICHKGKD